MWLLYRLGLWCFAKRCQRRAPRKWYTYIFNIVEYKCICSGPQLQQLGMCYWVVWYGTTPPATSTTLHIFHLPQSWIKEQSRVAANQFIRQHQKCYTKWAKTESTPADLAAIRPHTPINTIKYTYKDHARILGFSSTFLYIYIAGIYVNLSYN